METFIIHFKHGGSARVQGTDLADALRRAGYSAEDISYYEEVCENDTDRSEEDESFSPCP